jgi:outer membrane protein OmpA-like peptidoglycan-associated protein
MNTINHSNVIVRSTLIATAVASILLAAACATAPVKPDGAAEARAKLTQLQSDPNLASRAAVAIKDADAAVRIAEQPELNKELAAHRVYLADRKVDTAKALAETRFAEDQRAGLTAQRDSARLDARTHEADAAKVQAATARAEGAEQKLAADQARSEAGAAQLAAASSEQQAAELQRQIDVLQAKPTDRGLVLTLGDVLFTTGRADLKPGATGNLDKLVAFLNKYPDRSVAIQGYTDSVGTEDFNQRLSERRADSVKSYLTGQGIGSTRLSALGKGRNDPVADNDSATGRQQNRRVEVIISNPPAALR